MAAIRGAQIRRRRRRERGRERERVYRWKHYFAVFCTFSDQLRLRFDVAATSSVHVISGGKREDVGGRGRGEGVGRRGCYKLKKKKTKQTCRDHKRTEHI